MNKATHKADVYVTIYLALSINKLNMSHVFFKMAWIVPTVNHKHIFWVYAMER